VQSGSTFKHLSELQLTTKSRAPKLARFAMSMGDVDGDPGEPPSMALKSTEPVI
jgi:hypothetical protein